MKQRKRILPSIILIVAVFACAFLAVRMSGEPSNPNRQASGDERPSENVVLIILDTVRADRLGCYGNQRGLTPHIDAFAEESVRFSNAHAQSPWTLPSTASLFTSLYPSQHTAGGRFGAFNRLPSDAITLAEVFRDAGSRTGAILNVLFLGERFGMTQGFDHADVHDSRTNTDTRRAADTTDAAIEWIGTQGDEPFFLVVHYFDAHLVYDPPQPFRARFAAPEDADTQDWLYGTVEDMMQLRKPHSNSLPAPDVIRRLEMLYDGEVAYTDFHVGRLLDAIESLGISDETIVALTADHGEEFLEHGGFEHGHTFYDELLHVPLIIKTTDLPDDRKGTIVDTTVRLIDVAPTLVSAAGIPPDPGFEGRSLMGLVEGESEDNRSVLSQRPLWGLPGHALRADGYKLICRVKRNDRPRFELYDISADKGETANLAEKELELRRRLSQQLIESVKALEADSLQNEETNLTPAEVESLRSLGYTG